MTDYRMAVVTGYCAGTAIGVLLLLGVILTGNTFGQRCAALAHPWDSPEHSACVRELTIGG